MTWQAWFFVIVGAPAFALMFMHGATSRPTPRKEDDADPDE